MEFDGSILIKCRDVKVSPKLEHNQRMTLHCQQCNSVLGDSVSVCGDVKSLDSIMCLKVTDDVLVSDAKELGHKGELANCIYSSLKCRGCRSAVGKVIHSSSSRLSSIRSLFLLHKSNISCYILNSSSMVKASTLTLDMKSCTESLTEVRQQFGAQLDQMSRIKSRLAEMSLDSELDK